ncbi:P27 family phage terminase small subunit [Achromobacter denitrificans]|uniref:P27 family phage terminase small subunit n=1 Tax=Achromobacter denitrificans TaxID=32002 RepID=UPI0020C64FA9|nr:P27 family phage terminase small subunit [Achromobacter denitrificans]
MSRLYRPETTGATYEEKVALWEAGFQETRLSLIVLASGPWSSAATVANEAMKQMATFGSFLGLDPSSRQRMQGPKKAGKGNPFAALLGGG